MPRYRLDIEYDGAAYAGWQRQAGQHTVQAAIEQAIVGFCGEQVIAARRGPHRCRRACDRPGGACRPDARLDRPTRCATRSTRICKLNGEAVAILAAPRCRDDFDARFSATGRHYLYRILNRRAPPALEAGKVWWVPKQLDAAAMHEAAQPLLGRHDFTTFRSTQCQANSPVRTLDRLDVTPRRRRDRNPCLGALLPAQPGALDGRLAEARRGRAAGRSATSRPRWMRATAPPARASRRRTGFTWSRVDYPTEPARSAEQCRSSNQARRRRPATRRTCRRTRRWRSPRPCRGGVGQPPGQHHRSRRRCSSESSGDSVVGGGQKSRRSAAAASSRR